MPRHPDAPPLWTLLLLLVMALALHAAVFVVIIWAVKVLWGVL